MYLPGCLKVTTTPASPGYGRPAVNRNVGGVSPTRRLFWIRPQIAAIGTESSFSGCSKEHRVVGALASAAVMPNGYRTRRVRSSHDPHTVLVISTAVRRQDVHRSVLLQKVVSWQALSRYGRFQQRTGSLAVSGGCKPFAASNFAWSDAVASLNWSARGFAVEDPTMLHSAQQHSP